MSYKPKKFNPNEKPSSSARLSSASEKTTGLANNQTRLRKDFDTN
jgi:hypothetical protein